MKDLILILMLVLAGIIGYTVMGMIDRSIDRHANGTDRPVQEKRANGHAETGKPWYTHPGMPFFINLQRKSHTRSL